MAMPPPNDEQENNQTSNYFYLIASHAGTSSDPSDGYLNSYGSIPGNDLYGSNLVLESPGLTADSLTTYALDGNSIYSPYNQVTLCHSQLTREEDALTSYGNIRHATQYLSQPTAFPPLGQAFTGLDSALALPFQATAGNIVGPDFQKRKHRCLTCRRNGKNRDCVGSPLCNTCIKSRDRQGQQATSSLGSITYLDLIAWSEVCHNFRNRCIPPGGLRANPHDTIKLRMHFAASQCTKHPRPTSTVTLMPCLDELRFEENGLGLEPRMSLCAGVAITAELDSFVETVAWCKHCECTERHKLSEDTIRLFSLVKLFTAYFSLLYNLPSTTITSSGQKSRRIIGYTAAALLQALVIKIDELYSEIAKICDTPLSEAERGDNAFAILYALGSLYQLMNATARSTTLWESYTVERPLHPLSLLLREFEQRSRDIMLGILDYECQFSAISQDARLMRFRSLNQFGEKPTPFPPQLTVYADANLQSMGACPCSNCANLECSQSVVETLSNLGDQEFEWRS